VPTMPSLPEAVRLLDALASTVAPRPGEVRLAERAGVLWIELSSPNAHNALTASMMAQLGRAVVACGASASGVVVVASGHGGTFCSGGHLGQVRERLIARDAAQAMSAAMGTILDALRDLPALTIALVEGPAIGGGLEVVSACDLVFATSRASFDPAQVRLGVAAGWGGAARLADRLGSSVALRLLASGEPISAAQAVGIGLVDHLGEGPAERLLAEGAGAILARPAGAVRALKQQVRRRDDPAAQVAAFLEVWGSHTHRAALGLRP
jgi:enoyl-CoA hydratase/carnithine racemase